MIIIQMKIVLLIEENQKNQMDIMEHAIDEKQNLDYNLEK
jgi:hypothetical protein